MGSIEIWRTATITAAALGQTAFILLYVTFPWWRSFLGRALFLKSLTLLLLMDVAVLGRMFEWQNEDVTFVVLYGLVAFGVWAQFFAFLRTRALGEKRQAGGGFQKRTEAIR